MGADAMEVDEELIRLSHPLEHFAQLLLGVVDQVGGPEVPWDGPPTLSRHAPSWAKIAEWTPWECVRYLGGRTKTVMD
jgi:hypothetical protein